MSVKIYTTTTCHFCGNVKNWLKEHGIEYTEVDVFRDMEARKEMIEKSGQMGVPVTVIDDTKMIVGFDEKELEKALL